MRPLLYLIAVLMIANVGLFLWPDESSSAPHLYKVTDDINPNLLRLNKEVEARFYNQARTNTANQSEMLDEYFDLDVELAANADAGCYRLGPFAHKSNFELAQAVLFNAGIDYKSQERAQSGSVVTRLFLGPFEFQSQGAVARSELREKNISDHFLRKDPDGRYIVSLGIYSMAGSADRAIALFSEKGLTVQQRSENITLPRSYWVHFNLAGNSRARSELAAMDWGEKSAKMGLFDCLVN